MPCRAKFVSDWISLVNGGAFPSVGHVVHVYRPAFGEVDFAHRADNGTWIQDSSDERFDGRRLFGVTHWREQTPATPPILSDDDFKRALRFGAKDGGGA